MGQSTDALLWWGVALDEETPESLREILDGDEDDYDLEKFFESHDIKGVTLISHCSGDYPMYGLAVNEAFPSETKWQRGELRAYRGSPKTFTDLPKVKPEWTDLIKKVLGLLNIPTDDLTFGWVLASNWG